MVKRSSEPPKSSREEQQSHRPLVLADVEEDVTEMSPLAGDVGAGELVQVGHGLELRARSTVRSYIITA